MSIEKVDIGTFNDIKALKEQGVNSLDVAELMGMRLAEVNKIFSFPDYRSYIKRDEPPTAARHKRNITL